MKRSHFLALLVPSIVLLLVGGVAFYWSKKFWDLHLDALSSKLPMIEEKLRSIQCETLNKDALLPLIKLGLEGSQYYAEILDKIGWVAVSIGVFGALIVFDIRRRQLK